MLEILSYSFFREALIAWVLVCLISGTLGSLVVLRREPNITHSIANVFFVGIVISFFFQGNYYLFGIIAAIIWVFLLSCIEKYTYTSRESSKEILSQIGLAGGVFWVGFLWNMQIDIFNFLFGNILFVEKLDIYLLAVMLVLGAILYFFFGKKLIQIALSEEIAKSQGVHTGKIEFGYLLYLTVFIAVCLKIFGVLLLWAFLVLPGNTAKLLSGSLFGVFVIATILSVFAVSVWLFASYYLDTSAGATIVLILWGVFLISSFLRKK